MLDVLRVFFNARLVGCFKEIVQLRPVKLPVRKERPQRLLCHRPQDLPLLLPRHAQIFRQLVHQPGLQPPHILCRLLPHQIPIPPVLRRIPELADRRRVVRLRQRPVFKIIPDCLQYLVCVRPSGKLRAGDRVALRVVNVQNDLAAFLADKITERVHLCLCRHDSKIDASALRGNADVAFLHKAHHAAAVISAAVVLAQRVNDIPMIDRPVSAGPALVPPGEIQPCAVQQHIARLAPLVRPPEIVERGLVVLLSLLCSRLICAGREFPLCRLCGSSNTYNI